jgi:hypothetical protein
MFADVLSKMLGRASETPSWRLCPPPTDEFSRLRQSAPDGRFQVGIGLNVWFTPRDMQLMTQSGFNGAASEKLMVRGGRALMAPANRAASILPFTSASGGGMLAAGLRRVTKFDRSDGVTR